MSTTTEAPATVGGSTADTPHERRAWSRLYRGETHFDFVGHRRWWFLLSGIIILAGMVSLGVRGLNEGIDFKGGESWTVVAHGMTVNQATTAVQRAGVTPSQVQGLGTGSSADIQVEADIANLSAAQRQATEGKVSSALAAAAHTSASKVSLTDVGPTWGSEITDKAILAVIVFFVVVVLYITFRFEWKMAVAALIAVIHDLLVVAGVYSLSGLQVTPDTVVAVLTILGYSLYDTVVVFDRVADNGKGIGASGRMTYTDVVNLSMNQTLARSINTSLVAILPTLSVLIIGAEILGATTLQYFGFALVIGLISGAYSSLFIASPILAALKEREPRYRSMRQKLESRGDRTGLLTPRAAAQLAGATAAGGRSGTGRARPVAAGRPLVRAGSGRSGAGSRRPSTTPSPVLRPGSVQTPAASVADDGSAGDGSAGDRSAGGPVAGGGGTAAANGSARAGSSNGSARAGNSTGTKPANRSRSGSGSPARRPPAKAKRKGGSKKGGGRRH